LFEELVSLLEISTRIDKIVSVKKQNKVSNEEKEDEENEEE